MAWATDKTAPPEEVGAWGRGVGPAYDRRLSNRVLSWAIGDVERGSVRHHRDDKPDAEDPPSRPAPVGAFGSRHRVVGPVLEQARWQTTVGTFVMIESVVRRAVRPSSK